MRAEITTAPGGFMLTLRDRRGRIWRRRSHASVDDASREMWSYSRCWRAA